MIAAGSASRVAVAAAVVVAGVPVGPAASFTATATAYAMPPVWLRDSSTLVTPNRRAISATWPCSATRGLPPDSTSISRHTKPMMPIPRALPTASLAAKRAA